jgi:CubicO group peptidase (beta-lactamase class C family)/acyl carrier protein
MVPAVWQFMEALPLTSSGKLDRNALAAFVDSRPVVRRPPSTQIESDLVEMWSEVLGIRQDTICASDNFFNLGGHSLAAVQLTYLVARRLNIQMPMRDLLIHATLEDLARYIASQASTGPGQITVDAAADDAERLPLADDLSGYIRYKEQVFAESYQISGSKSASLPSGLESQEYLSNLQAHLQKYVVKYNTPGLTVAVHRAGTDYVACAGVESLESKKEVTQESGFSPGCIAKLYTATVLMQLVHEGKLSLNDPVCAHMSEFKLLDRMASDQTTILNLLNHTSGIDQSALDGIFFGGTTGIERYVSALQCSSVHFPPGTGAFYSDADYIIAARLAEVVTGKHWDALLHEYILDPIQCMHPTSARTESCARYVLSARSPGSIDVASHNSSDPINANNPADGTNFSLNIRTLLAFAKLHCPWVKQGEELGRTRHFDREAMRNTVVQYGAHPDFNGFGLSWLFYRDGSFGHSGNGVGHQSALRIFPSQQTAVVLLANRFPATAVLNEILANISEVRSPQATAEQVAVVETDKLLGTFKCDGGAIYVSATPTHLKLTLCDKGSGERHALLHQIPQTQYFSVLSDTPGLSGLVMFLFPDAHGKPRYLAHKLRWYRRM